jgi:DNA repair protein RecO (recombination protein O)
MPEILKTRALVIRKLNYGDSSIIADFFTEHSGKISAIIKGARTSKSRMGKLVDICNLVEIVFYHKESREIQFVKEVDLVEHYHEIKNDLDRLKYLLAISELLEKLTIENEPHERLFRGVEKILMLMNETGSDYKFLFARFFLFFIEELGYQIPLSNCSSCGKEITGSGQAAFNFIGGILCSACKKNGIEYVEMTEELLEILFCLSRKNCNKKFAEHDLNRIISLFEKYMMHHVHEFKGLKSLKLY